MFYKRSYRQVCASLSNYQTLLQNTILKSVTFSPFTFKPVCLPSLLARFKSFLRQFVCPGCKLCYVGKTYCTLHGRTIKNAYVKVNKNKQNAIYEHLSSCTHYNHIADIFEIDTNSFNSSRFNLSQIRNNTIILDRGDSWNVLLFKEALMIKKHGQSLICGLMASKE